MKKAEISAFARLTPLLLFCISFSVYAQKLPKVQANSLIAPDNIRIDGRTNEWNDKYQAYNRHTDIYYTIPSSLVFLHDCLHVTKKRARSTHPLYATDFKN